MTQYDVVVAGAGIWGCTVARTLAEAGRKVLVLEKREAPGGNVRSATDPANGIEVHLYGSHIFHTASERVWRFANRFTEFNGYRHKVLARHAGRTYFLPLGLALVNGFFGVELSPEELPAFMKDEARSKALFDAFFRGYTSKQWGLPPEELDPSVIKRVPVRANYDINYFNDWRQGIPIDGYNAFFGRMLDHPGISLECGVDWLEWRKANRRDAPVFYSGPVDELFGYRFGELPWRTLRFENEVLTLADFQGTSVVNYTDAEVPYTRIHEFKHYHPERAEVMNSSVTAICREYPKAWHRGDEPYYPIDNAASRELAARYFAEAAKDPNLVVGGRLGLYRYFDMDKSMESALDAAAEFLAR